MSGNTFGGTQWSDTKSVYPMLPRINPIQKCNSCGRYWFASSAKTKQGDEVSFEKGELNFPNTKEALEQLWTDRIDAERKTTLLLSYVYAFNDQYFRNDVKEIPSNEDEEIFDKVVLSLIESDINDTLKAELYREAKRFGECIEFLDSAKPVEGFEDEVRKQIYRKAQEEDRKVFEI